MFSIEAVVVNRNSSAYTELLLRSLHARNPDVEGLNVTVVDGHSSDDGVAKLRDYTESQHIPFQLTSDRYFAAGNSHGEHLRDFALEHSTADYFLFLDSDVAFLEDGTILAMQEQLEARPDAFGVQALLSRDGGNEQEIGSDYCAQERIYCNWVTGSTPESVQTGVPTSASAMYYKMSPRLPPCCALVRNSNTFLLVAEIIGFSCAHTLAAAGGRGYDTFALMIQVMRTHGLRHLNATKMVLHFGGVCCGQDTPQKQALRDSLLSELRDKVA